jgi:hypothetical protein
MHLIGTARKPYADGAIVEVTRGRSTLAPIT